MLCPPAMVVFSIWVLVMLYLLKNLSDIGGLGPLRMLGSHLVLIAVGAALSLILSFIMLPKLWNRLPQDRGKSLTPDGKQSAGKPTGAGIIFFLAALPVLVLVLPVLPSAHHAFVGENGGFSWKGFSMLLSKEWLSVGCIYLAMVCGYLDDRAVKPWSRGRKLVLDAFVSILAGLALCNFQSMELWFPFTKAVVVVPWPVYTLVAAFVIAVSLNVTNCSDGIDGLLGTQTVISLLLLTVFLYGVVGHEKIASYLLIPHNPDGAVWAIMTSTFVGALLAYLWFNAEPSSVLMGDAGSRGLGMLIGIIIMVIGNPFIIFAIMPVVLFDGACGLIKIIYLNFLKKIGKGVAKIPVNKEERKALPWHHIIAFAFRCPIHDHCRKELGWSKVQVVIRFMIIQIVLIPTLLLLILKVR
jgi:phospho-N-acetylmuramoyl-pentapeptide-transferase